ncbi:unnamed protein product [Ilex paraguariensis]|uniref:Uncharacterized protein n=1 Tax=Ilex paraguariensis TaxID=185542 RepID=A0ABC8U165_9AQUA
MSNLFNPGLAELIARFAFCNSLIALSMAQYWSSRVTRFFQAPLLLMTKWGRRKTRILDNPRPKGKKPNITSKGPMMLQAAAPNKRFCGTTRLLSFNRNNCRNV